MLRITITMSTGGHLNKTRHRQSHNSYYMSRANFLTKCLNENNYNKQKRKRRLGIVRRCRHRRRDGTDGNYGWRRWWGYRHLRSPWRSWRSEASCECRADEAWTTTDSSLLLTSFWPPLLNFYRINVPLLLKLHPFSRARTKVSHSNCQNCQKNILTKLGFFFFVVV